jgi:hypothetical protein
MTAGIAAAQSYTATSLQPPSGSAHFVNLIGLNNKGQVLGDACTNGTACIGTDRFPAIWTKGVIAPLPIPMGYVYIAILYSFAINDSGTVVGALQVAGTANTFHVVVWANGVPSILPDAQLSCSGGTAASSLSFGITAAGHIVGSTNYQANSPCSSYWVYNGTGLRLLPVAEPPTCTPAPSGAPALGAAINDADLVLQTFDNFSCSGFPASEPYLVQTNGSTSFVPLGSLAAAVGTGINDVGEMIGGTDPSHVIVWDSGGIHDLGPSGYGHLNQAGQVLYLGGTGSFYLWQNGVSTVLQLPPGLFNGAQVPASLNDTGQFTAGDGANFYLFSPSGACAADVTSEIQITRGGLRLNRTTGLFVQTVTITNTGSSSISGPISLALDNLPASASLYGISGATLCDQPQGSPYVNITTGSLNPGGSVRTTLEFIDAAKTGISYSARVLAGQGGR